MSDFPFLSPTECVFYCLRNIRRIATEVDDLSQFRPLILRNAERALSWETVIPNEARGCDSVSTMLPSENDPRH